MFSLSLPLLWVIRLVVYGKRIAASTSEIYSRRSVVSLMQLHTGAELFGNVFVQYSELTSKYHIGAEVDVNRPR